METLVLNGTTYTKASRAARDLGYTADYVGQLCRSGKVDAQLVGRTWYVNPDTLTHHRVEKKRMARVKAREQVKKSLEDHKKLKVVETKNLYKNIGIRYESDDSDLMPSVRKLDVVNVSGERAHEKRKTTSVEEQPGESYEIENEGNKIIMSGTIVVSDASDEAVDDETTLLTPRINRRSRNYAKDTETNDDSAEESVPMSRKSFLDRVEEQSIEAPLDSTESYSAVVPQEDIGTPAAKSSVVPYVLVVVVTVLVSFLSIGLRVEHTYSQGALSDAFAFDMSEAMTILKLKI